MPQTVEDQLAQEFAQVTGDTSVVVPPVAETPPVVEPTPVAEPSAATTPTETTPVAPVQPTTTPEPVVPPVQQPTEQPLDELAQLRADNEALRQSLAEIARGFKPQIYPPTQETQTIPQQTQTTVPTQTPTQPTPPTQLSTQRVFSYDPINPLTAEELDELIDKPELIVKAINDARINALTQVETVLPYLIESTVNRQILINKTVTDFYDTNRDLIPYSEFFQAELAKVEMGNRDKTYREIFDLAAKETRTKLRLKEPEQVTGTTSVPPAQTRGVSPTTTQTPAFASSRTSSAVGPSKGPKEGLDKEWTDLFG